MLFFIWLWWHNRTGLYVIIEVTCGFRIKVSSRLKEINFFQCTVNIYLELSVEASQSGHFLRCGNCSCTADSPKPPLHQIVLHAIDFSLQAFKLFFLKLQLLC